MKASQCVNVEIHSCSVYNSFNSKWRERKGFGVRTMAIAGFPNAQKFPTLRSNESKKKMQIYLN